MFLTKEQVEERLSTKENFDVSELKKKYRGGRKKGSKEISPETRTLIGIMAHTQGVKATIEQTGRSLQTVQGAKDGRPHSSQTKDPSVAEEVKKVVEHKKDLAENKAIDILNRSLGLISDDDIKAAKLSEKSRVGKDMSAIVKNLRQEVPANIGVAVKFEVYDPGTRKESDYKSVVIE